MRETGLTLSVGVSFNKVFAKLGSDYKSPTPPRSSTRMTSSASCGLCRWKAFCTWAVPLQKTLAGLGVRNIGQLAGADPGQLQQALGKLGGETAPVRTGRR